MNPSYRMTSLLTLFREAASQCFLGFWQNAFHIIGLHGLCRDYHSRAKQQSECKSILVLRSEKAGTIQTRPEARGVLWQRTLH